MRPRVRGEEETAPSSPGLTRRAASPPKWELDARRVFESESRTGARGRRMTHSQLKAYLKQASWAGSHLRGKGFHWKELWESYDGDGDGALTAGEFTAFYRERLLPLIKQAQAQAQDGTQSHSLSQRSLFPAGFGGEPAGRAEEIVGTPPSDAEEAGPASRASNLNLPRGSPIRSNPFASPPPSPPTSPARATRGTLSPCRSPLDPVVADPHADLLGAREEYTEAGGEGADKMSARQIVADLVQRGTSAAVDALHKKQDIEAANEVWRHYSGEAKAAYGALTAMALVQAATSRLTEMDAAMERVGKAATDKMRQQKTQQGLHRGLTSWMRSHVEAKSARFSQVAAEGEELLQESTATIGALITKARKQDALLEEKEGAMASSDSEIERLQLEVERLTADQVAITQQSQRLRERIVRLEDVPSGGSPYAPGKGKKPGSVAAYNR